MFVTTFYSFKGGVGRTMALVNVAYELASNGRRVLLVDFDLEAPGLTTYGEFSSAAGKHGIVEYVCNYLATGSAPDVREFIHECRMGDTDNNSVWVMPAGGAEYGSKYSQIDWQKLYGEHEGFLFFEDLKQQWCEAVVPSFDYVLIDSRTGHTDVGGICTRQLPDAVVAMFYPNSQNVTGMAEIVSGIRQQMSLWDKVESIIFCPSDVPDLDDEEGILESKLDYAAQMLGYQTPNVVINHYGSLDLIEQAIFTKDRPRTKLAAQYRELFNEIVRLNLEDKEGALEILREHRMKLRSGVNRVKKMSPMRGQRDTFWSKLENDLRDVQRLHPRDGEVAWNMALVYGELGQIDSAINALSIAIEDDYRSASARRKRAELSIQKKSFNEAIDDLRAVIASRKASPIDLSASISLLSEIDNDWVSVIGEETFDRLEADDKAHLATQLLIDRVGSNRAADILNDVIDARPKNSPHDYQIDLMLALIGAGRFREAMLATQKTPEEIEKSPDIHEVFNYAMAAWGENKRVPTGLLMHVLELHEKRQLNHANYLQCIALVQMGLGDFASASDLLDRVKEELGPGRVFSCWTYLYRRRSEMLADIQEMEMAVRKKNVRPRFLGIAD